MFRGLGKLTWIEIKIFMREPLGAIGTIVVPVLVFVLVGRAMTSKSQALSMSNFARVGLPVMASILIAISAVLSLVTIISIYREGGILKRLRATPLRPQTILGAHVLVKLLLTAATLLLMVLAGKRYIPPGVHPPIFSFMVALVISTWSILSIGFFIASIVPTARFAQPIGAVVLYPMVGLSGLFAPVASFPPVFRVLAHLSPMNYAVNLLEGIWDGNPWSAHMGDVAILMLFFLLFTALSAKVFRWE
ncbi:MAG TPA: ABC transporter permease [Terracidiphilus sp.]|jgi:ABC-2 type transport system permease protein